MQASPQPDAAATLRSQGISALRSGDKARARDLLAQAIRLNPRDELAWLWMSGAVESDYDSRRCLERVLELNPRSEAAAQGLASLAHATTPPQARPPAPASPPAPPSERPTASQTLSALSFAMPASQPAGSKELPAAPAEAAPPDDLASLRPPARRWQLNPLIVAIVAVALVAAFLGLRVASRFFGGTASLPTAAPALAAAATAVPTATQPPTPTRPRPTATATPTPSPTPTATPTPAPTTLPTSTVARAASFAASAAAKAEQHDYKGAIADYTQALKFDPRNADLYYQRAAARDAAKDAAGAIKDFTSSLRYAPDYPLSYAGRGAIYQRLGSRKSARTDYQKALALYEQRDDTANAELMRARLKELE